MKLNINELSSYFPGTLLGFLVGFLLVFEVKSNSIIFIVLYALYIEVFFEAILCSIFMTESLVPAKKSKYMGYLNKMEQHSNEMLGFNLALFIVFFVNLFLKNEVQSYMIWLLLLIVSFILRIINTHIFMEARKIL